MLTKRLNILVKYPTRARPSKFMKNLDEYYSKLSGNNNVDFVITMDADDKSMNNLHMIKWLNNKPNLMYFYGESKGKIHAINRDIPVTPWDIVIVTADDMEPVEQNWDDIIAQDYMSSFNDFSGSINYNIDPRLESKGPDGYKTLITLPIIGRQLYDKFGYVYHPSYKSEYCDNEQTEIFEKLGVLKHIDKRPIIHKWADNQDALMQRNMQVGWEHDRELFEKRKKNGFDNSLQKSNKIVQITLVKNEIDVIKHMLPVWTKYADSFVFMDDHSTDGTYEYLLQNKQKYNILNVIRPEQKPNMALYYESIVRQQLFDEALKYSDKIVCLDADEYLDGNFKKQDLINLLNNNTDTIFYSRWTQYVDLDKIRVDGKWKVHWVDRFACYSDRCFYKNKQTHAEHLPLPSKTKYIDYPDIFVSHLAWLPSKEYIAYKQYHYKILDYVSKLQHNVNIINPIEYDYSVNNFNWEVINIPFTLQVPRNIYQERDKNIRDSKYYKYIKENVSKYNIPNLNDWGMGIH